MGIHVIEQGEHLSQIAEREGFRDAMTIWNAGENAELRAKRENPGVLYPGDELFVPDKIQQRLPRPTTQTHVFVTKVDLLKLRVAIVDFDNRPIANEPGILVVEGRRRDVTTDGDGVVEVKVPRSARSGQLSFPKYGIELPMSIGELDPVDEASGWRARLVNLGYYRGGIDDDGEVAEKLWSWALEEFQCDMKLKVTGQPDGATLARLKKEHGS